jgi:hypothetical protein
MNINIIFIIITVIIVIIVIVIIVNTVQHPHGLFGNAGCRVASVSSPNSLEMSPWLWTSSEADLDEAFAGVLAALRGLKEVSHW